jgi:Zn-dependent protease
MDFFNTGIPLGRWFGINVRLHFTFLVYAYYQATKSGDLFFGLAFVAALYFCILLHEFGHALAARWCDGEANDILLWPLGGLAFVRPAWSPTAHLITTVAGPFVTLVLWVLLSVISHFIPTHLFYDQGVKGFLATFVSGLGRFNGWLLLFNLIPAFPMDGGRILRDTLWHWMRAETATRIAVRVSWVIAGAGAVFAVYIQDFWLLVFPLFIIWQSASEQQMVAYEAGGAYQFSLRERLRRGRRQRAFRGGVREFQRDQSAKPFHQCATCGATERDTPRREFRVCTECSDGREYCDQHLESHVHA